MKKVLVLILSILLLISMSVLCACTGEYSFSGDSYKAESSTGSVNFASLNIETENVEKVSKKILSGAINNYGGIKVSIKEYFYDDGDDSSYLVIKIPNENLEDFIAFASKDVDVTSKDIRSYVLDNDIDSLNEEKSVLETNKTKYEGLLAEATTIADKLEVQKQIDIIEKDLLNKKNEIASFETNLSYTQVYINIYNDSISCDECSSISFVAFFNLFNVLAIVLAIVFGVKYSNARRKLKKYEKENNNQPLDHTYNGGENKQN